jgi:polyphosphate kinase 2
MANKNAYKTDLRDLQIALVRYQAWAMETDARAVVVFEGRDGAGKDGSIARITEHLAPRRTRIVSLPKPSDRDRSEWYFQRYVRHLPAGGEIVLFNRSWYNRAGVEPVMGFCTDQQHAEFLRDAPVFEAMLVESGVRLVKLWLDISKREQAERLDARRTDPLKGLKISALDGVAQKKWKAYSAARDEMLARTHSPAAPWLCVRADHKKTARLAIIRCLLHALAPPEVRKDVGPPDPAVLFPFEAAAVADGRLAK